MLIKQYLQRFFDIRPFKYQTARSFRDAVVHWDLNQMSGFIA